ncbi:hypothetical protein [Runella zeae]|uniref:hypothetical protein n=1 Tax=Runella zeae TaxID=94255 RepID=UPI0023522309|nr:hypothetical protein [Runella zeae]
MRFDNQVQGADSVPFYDNQWRYKMKRLNGYSPQYWENKLKALVKEWGPRVIECSLHDVADGQWPNQQNRIAQLVTNGHFLF